MKKYKAWIKLTQCISETLWKLNVKRYETLLKQLKIFSEQCSVFPQNTQCYSKAIEKQWYRAADKVQERICLSLNDFTFKAQQFKEKFSIEKLLPSSTSMLFAELRQIELEFGQLSYDLENKTLSVYTEPIVLQDISFGSFEIKLTIERMLHLYEGSPYRIIALDPNPAGTNKNVTHPHVSDEYLCEGDGCLPIRKALEDGRICDFFMMIDQILNTYNPDSPYVALSDWDGCSCYDCGYTVSNDDSYYCENCNESFCDECSGYCKICDDTLCRGCLRECPDCQEPVCKHCLGVCQECERLVCTDCLEENICHVCIENRKEENQNEETTTTNHPIPAVQSNGMGQTRVSA